ncbi:F-box domain protein [Taphrina deformans PYCC 5710]|uniref:F-box domain protein n=1 Tax=Taphrina deformans (strain PYCC 5710 / ATCC 11124 / CBS 356.35 / IMI 108563 / JCM 9778 / NBRC 8474) TaxID=1097556 RepID=R4XDS8_TAPDE|nr:F-box domain protein [Taphrina deformans PYCC 5710]|eukprot:CCG82575.1 F-box domain protein [Taphrina deformans PYCC 5710]
MDYLPVETIQQIFSCLTDPKDTINLARCNRLLYRIGTDDSLWRRHLTSWNYSNETLPTLYQYNAPPVVRSVDARETFRRRKTLDRRMELCILTIVENPHGRLKYIEAISDYFMDAADAVRAFRLRNGRINKNYGIDYYCCLLERHISRKLGIHILQKMASRDKNPVDSCDALFALYAIGSFHRSDGLDFHLPSTLNELQQAVLDLAGSDWEDLPVHDTTQSPEEDRTDKLSIIMQALTNAGIRPASGPGYYDLRNSFLYCAMKEKRPTIPITMVAIFVALCTRLGLSSSAIGFPGQVLAAVKDGDSTVYVAPYEGGKCYLRAELVNRLHSYGMPDVDAYLSPCTTEDLCIRSSRNILNCIERGTDMHTLDGLYAALVTLRLMGHPLPLAEDQFMTLITLHYPYDIGIWERLHIPEHQELIRQARLEDVTVRRPKRRSEQPVEIRHRVGVVFRHALFNYTAVITGWDHYCDQSPEWIRQMRVNLLERKTKQPFYNVLVSDGSERYVAEDNVLPITDNESPVFQSLADLEIIGKYFQSSVDNQFVLSSDLMQAYPDDH